MSIDTVVQSDRAPATGARRETPGRWIALAGLVVSLLALTQRFGEIVYLTRLDRVLDPWRMAARDIDLWNPHWDLGALQFQTIGYWIPFDLFFGAGSSLGIPPWLTERAFIAVLLVTAIWGFVRLTDELRIGVPAARVIGALAYATSPVVLTRVGWQSVFAMGVVLLPWVLLPLVRATERSTSPRRAAARSAIAVALIGGANAAVTLATLPVPLLYLLSRQRGRARARLLRWWCLAVPMATAWWTVGLVFYARYGPDVLVYTEQVEDTVAATPTFEVLRGTADWVLGLDAASPAGAFLAGSDVAMIATAALGAVGLAGLSRRAMPERKWLVICLVAGVAAVGGGFGGLFGNPADGAYRSLLAGPLEAFRNVYKFQPLIALPIALGVVEVLGAAWDRARTTPANERRTRAVVRHGRPGSSVAAWAVIAVLIVLAATPLWTDRLTRGPGFDEIPEAWSEARDHLSERVEGRVLIVPGIPEGDFDWGFTAQLPLQWGSDLTWATRSQAPLGGVEGVEQLDAVEQAIERGGDPGLPAYLERGGIAAVVVPNDQLSTAYGAPPPESVNAALVASGLQPTAGFGRVGYGFGDLRQIEIYELPGEHRATTYPAASATRLSGDIASTMVVPEAEFGRRPFLLAHDELAGPIEPTTWIVSDGNLATTNNYGFNRNNESYVYGPMDEGFADEDLLDHTTQVLEGVDRISASSVGPGIFVVDSPAAQPANAVDGDSSTSWQPRRYDVFGPDRWGRGDLWLEMEFSEPRRLDPLVVEMLRGPFGVDTGLEVTVETDAGARTTVIDATEERQSLAVPDGLTERLRVSISLEDVLEFGDVIGIRELTMPGSPFTRRLQVPDQPTDEFAGPGEPDPAWVFTRQRPAVAPLVALNAEDQIRRVFDLPKVADLEMGATGRPGPGDAVVRFLGRSDDLVVTAETTWGDAPALGPRHAVDGVTTTEWRSAVPTGISGSDATLRLRWDERRVISRVRIDVGPYPVPDTVLVDLDGRGHTATVDDEGWVHFPATRARQLALTLRYAPSSEVEPVGLRELEVPALADLMPGPVEPSASVRMTCRNGPSLRFDDRTVPLRGTATVGDLYAGTRIDMEPCGDEAITLSAGRHVLDAASGEVPITVEQVVLGNAPALQRMDEDVRSLDVGAWESTRRDVEIGPGDEALLVINELQHPAWRATLDGVALDALRVDGWRQGFVVPEGSGGTVELVFVPDRLFKVGTALGVLALAGVVVLAVGPRRRPEDPRGPIPVGEPAGRLLVAIVVLGAVWSTGVAAALLVPLWWARRRRPAVLAWIAAAGLTSAAVLTAVGRGLLESDVARWQVDSWPVALLTSLSLLACLASVLPTPAGERPPGEV